MPNRISPSLPPTSPREPDGISETQTPAPAPGPDTYNPEPHSWNAAKLSSLRTLYQRFMPAEELERRLGQLGRAIEHHLQSDPNAQYTDIDRLAHETFTDVDPFRGLVIPDDVVPMAHPLEDARGSDGKLFFPEPPRLTLPPFGSVGQKLTEPSIPDGNLIELIGHDLNLDLKQRVILKEKFSPQALKGLANTIAFLKVNPESLRRLIHQAEGNFWDLLSDAFEAIDTLIRHRTQGLARSFVPERNNDRLLSTAFPRLNASVQELAVAVWLANNVDVSELEMHPIFPTDWRDATAAELNYIKRNVERHLFDAVRINYLKFNYTTADIHVRPRGKSTGWIVESKTSLKMFAANPTEAAAFILRIFMLALTVRRHSLEGIEYVISAPKADGDFILRIKEALDMTKVPYVIRLVGTDGTKLIRGGLDYPVRVHEIKGLNTDSPDFQPVDFSHEIPIDKPGATLLLSEKFKPLGQRELEKLKGGVYDLDAQKVIRGTGAAPDSAPQLLDLEAKALLDCYRGIYIYFEHQKEAGIYNLFELHLAEKRAREYFKGLGWDPTTMDNIIRTVTERQLKKMQTEKDRAKPLNIYQRLGFTKAERIQIMKVKSGIVTNLDTILGEMNIHQDFLPHYGDAVRILRSFDGPIVFMVHSEMFQTRHGKELEAMGWKLIPSGFGQRRPPSADESEGDGNLAENLRKQENIFPTNPSQKDPKASHLSSSTGMSRFFTDTGTLRGAAIKIDGKIGIDNRNLAVKDHLHRLTRLGLGAFARGLQSGTVRLSLHERKHLEDLCISNSIHRLRAFCRKIIKRNIPNAGASFISPLTTYRPLSASHSVSLIR